MEHQKITIKNSASFEHQEVPYNATERVAVLEKFSFSLHMISHFVSHF